MSIRLSQSVPLAEIASLFLKIGTVSFGGPAAHIALMEDEVVRRRGWLTRAEFLDLIGATNLIPGPNSTEIAIHVGYRKAGAAGLLLAGICFILPASLIVSLFAWAYVQYGSLPQTGHILYGVKPVIIAIILQALWGFGRSFLKTNPLVVACVAGAILNIAGVNELIILFGAGLLFGLANYVLDHWRADHHFLSFAFGAPLAALAQYGATGVAAPYGLWTLVLFFLKVGSVLFGSGYVLLVFLRADLVERWHWLTETQLLDAIAVGQITPGPIFTTATFVGYLLGGGPGAVGATIGIFLPAFFFVAISGPIIPRIRGSATAGAFLDGVNAASIALMAVVTYQLGRTALIDATSIVLAVAGAVAFFRFRVNTAWLVLGGAAAGLLSGIFS